LACSFELNRGDMPGLVPGIHVFAVEEGYAGQDEQIGMRADPLAPAWTERGKFLPIRSKGRASMSTDRDANRRRFLQFLAASPLLAAGAGSAVAETLLPKAWQPDSGFRRGTDIVKALAMGATAVGIGRPYIWGLGAFGQPGVERVLELLRIELRTMMQQVGAPTIKDLKPAMVQHV
jgi:hypothetical protein